MISFTKKESKTNIYDHICIVIERERLHTTSYIGDEIYACEVKLPRVSHRADATVLPNYKRLQQVWPSSLNNKSQK